jgi:hypothetical protein
MELDNQIGGRQRFPIFAVFETRTDCFRYCDAVGRKALPKLGALPPHVRVTAIARNSYPIHEVAIKTSDRYNVARKSFGHISGGKDCICLAQLV